MDMQWLTEIYKLRMQNEMMKASMTEMFNPTNKSVPVIETLQRLFPQATGDQISSWAAKLEKQN